MLTHFPPVIDRIYGTRHLDAFDARGEPIAIRYLCEGGIQRLFGQLTPDLVPTLVGISTRFASPVEAEAHLQNQQRVLNHRNKE